MLAVELVVAEWMGMDLGGELGDVIEPKPRPRGVGRAEPVPEPVPVEVSSESLFVRKPSSCAPNSVGSGVTGLTLAFGFAGGVVGLVRPGRYAVLRRLPAEVLRGIANLTGGPAPVAVGEADLSSRSRPAAPWAKGKSKVCISGTVGREADGRRERGGGRAREAS